MYLHSNSIKTAPSHYHQSHLVTTTSLYGVPIASIEMNGNKMLCLAHISKTLLKPFTYNQIHNRRVALGIPCVQCPPIAQMKVMRQARIPSSVRRCSMIFKHEAERLVKSFLEKKKPLKLPNDFSFQVTHDFGWGCEGSFIPSRYISSRAKCVKCNHCGLYFSPNSFIFHHHPTPDSVYRHPDTINSWRKHLHLKDAKDTALANTWEQVKALFTGSNNKKLCSPQNSFESCCFLKSNGEASGFEKHAGLEANSSSHQSQAVKKEPCQQLQSASTSPECSQIGVSLMYSPLFFYPQVEHYYVHPRMYFPPQVEEELHLPSYAYPQASFFYEMGADIVRAMNYPYISRT